MNDDKSLSSARPTEAALTGLITDCPELAELEVRLSQFNIFRVLGADRSELRHSNMLAWLCDPAAAHGLGELFLRRWLIALMLQTSDMDTPPTGWITPIAIDVLDIDYVETHREFDSIDLLIRIHPKQGKPWILCIENKVGATQGPNQLERYHERVERRFEAAARRIYVFLTARPETAGYPEFIETSYRTIANVLEQCVKQQEDSIGPEPLLLLNHYQQLLREDFMDDSEAAQLARQIYLRHRQALDFIFENKVDPIFEATSALVSALDEAHSRLGVKMEPYNKGYVRFTPKEWAIPENSGGSAWGGSGRYLLCEVYLWGKTAILTVAIGHAPDAWADKVWQHAIQNQPPFSPTRKKQPKYYPKIFSSKSNITIENLRGLDEKEIGEQLLNWLEGQLKSPKFEQVVHDLAKFLPDLKTN